MSPRYRHLKIEQLAIDTIKSRPRSARRHSPGQISQIALSIQSFDFNVPLLLDGENVIVAGEARFAAAKMLGYDHLPAIRLGHLSPMQVEAFRLADNRLAELATWDEQQLGEILLELSTAQLDFSLEATGFTMGEIDLKIEGLGGKPADAADDLSAIAPATPISLSGDTWILGNHRVHCGSSLELESYETLMRDRLAVMVLTDPPFNVRIRGNVSGKGKNKHREFAMASGEMTKAEFDLFLRRFMKLAAAHSEQGSLHYMFIDWRHLAQLQGVAELIYGDPINLCVWAKTNAGMGSMYRSAHELILVFKPGKAPHRNNVQLGRFGRNRTNVWTYPSPSQFRESQDKSLLALHPTVKPVGLLADAILDASARGDIVLDPFLGSGSTLLAAEHTGRTCRGIEIDPLYVDLAIRRWQLMTGQEAVHANSGETFANRAAEIADVA